MSRLIYTRANGNGGLYEYFVCSGRQNGDCRQPHHRVRAVEQAIERYYRQVDLTDGEREYARAQIERYADARAELGQKEVEAAWREVDKLLAQEAKLFAAQYADNISPALFERESARIRTEQNAAQTALASHELRSTTC